MKHLCLFGILVFFSSNLFCQTEKMEVEGAIIIGDSESVAPVPGTIRWTGTDFEGWNGTCWLSLTNGQVCTPPVTDGDGNVYQTVQICNQEWLLTDLATTTCNDGTPIPEVTSDVAWEALSTGAFCWYNNDQATQVANGFGALYNWYIIDECNICPVGYHVATDAEWIELTECIVGGPVDPNQTGATNLGVGDALRETGTAHWMAPNAATNTSGFTAFGGGFRDSDALFGTFWHITEAAGYWCSDDGPQGGWQRSLSNQNGYIYRYPRDKRYGFSVRCIKD